MTNSFKLITSLGLCFLVAGLGSIVTVPSISSWYAALNKPFFNPPNWIFGPVWTVLYIMMALSFYLIWTTKSQPKKIQKAGLFFGLQLFFNFLWSFVFFYLHLPTAAFITIVCLWLSIFYTIIVFKKINALAAYLLVPYIAWVSFASLLNLFIVILN